MPFGLTNASATFQVYINKALAGLVDVIYIVYLDDILIFLNTEEDYIRDIREVLLRLRSSSLYYNLSKYKLFIYNVFYLGF